MKSYFGGVDENRWSLAVGLTVVLTFLLLTISAGALRPTVPHAGAQRIGDEREMKQSGASAPTATASSRR